MGLKKTNYDLKELGIKIPNAYAQIDTLSVDINGNCTAIFKIQSAREDMDKRALENQFISMTVDKTLPIFEQVYNQAKEEIFIDWEDDIVE